VKFDEGEVRCERGEYRGEVGDDITSSPGCDIEPGLRGKGESGGANGFNASRGDLVRRSGATVSPFIALITKLVDVGEFEVGVEVKEPYVELGYKAPDTDSETDAEICPDVDCNTRGEGFDKDCRSLSMDLEEDAWVESKEVIDCALEVAWTVFDQDVDVETIEEDEVGTDLVLDEACPKPGGDGTAPLDKDDSSVSRQSSASEYVVEVALEVDATEYTEDTDTDAVNSGALLLDRSYSLTCSGEEGCEYMSGERGFRPIIELPGCGSEEASGFAAKLPGRNELELSALVPLKLSDHDGDTLSSERERESATARDPRFAMIGRLSFP